ncbi:MAG: VCBS repeat-containing protein [Deltaproteobacteria bacterium]|nr:VCBS repeat-containing protein [Deltaproteobacteria bacterium]MBK8714935.1 VCBS repeat-containing protein [Deltaproteobacteria bacterium]MBP7287465.1 VCBS repeat-containing protein [Nannocystaceae bacterium]
MVLDVSRWNLGGSVGATAAIVLGGCGPVVLSPGQDTESTSDTDSSSVSESESESETDPPTTTETVGGCDDGCPSGYYCDGNACIPYGCADGGCCYDGDCCYYDGSCYYNECYSVDDCGGEAVCMSGIDWGNFCQDVPMLPECELPLAPTPIPMVADGQVLALTFFAADADASRELVVATPSNVTVLAGGTGVAGAPLFAEPMQVNDVAVGDLDGDGDEDLAVALADDGGQVVTFLNDGSGILTLGGNTALLATRVEIADIDGDGRGDVVGQFDSVEPTALGVALSLEGGAFGPVQLLSTGITLYDFATGELDGGNGREVVAHLSTATWRWNGGGVIDDNPEGQFWLQAAGDDAPGPLAIATNSVLGDRVARALELSFLTYVEVFDGYGGGVGAFALPAGQHALVAADLDGEGREALVFATSSGRLSVIREALDCVSSIDLGYRTLPVVAAGDFNGDGLEDIATGSGIDLTIWTTLSP